MEEKIKNEKPPLTREEAAWAVIDAAIKKDLEANPPDASTDPAYRAYNLIQELMATDMAGWLTTQAQIIWGLITARYQRKADRRIRKKFESDPRQGWLALPDFAHVPQVLKVETGYVPTNEAALEQYDESLEDLVALRRGYLTPRITDENLRLLNLRIREMKKARRGAARQLAGAPEMKMGEAMALYVATLGTEATKQRRKAAKRATKARWGRT